MSSFFFTVLQHHPPGSSVGELAIVGALTGLTVWLISYFIEKKDKKRAAEDSLFIDRKTIAENSSVSIISNEDYDTLYETLIAECNPLEFMNPYDAEKVKIANEIYSQLSSNADNIPNLIELRNDAINKLGIKLSAKTIFDKLSSAFNPSQFMGENYDAKYLEIANDVYKQILANENDIIKLEGIAKQCGVFNVNYVPHQSSPSSSENTGLPVDSKGSSSAPIIFIFFVSFVSFALLIAIAIILDKDNDLYNNSSELQQESKGFVSKTNIHKESKYSLCFEAELVNSNNATISWDVPAGFHLISGPERSIFKSISISNGSRVIKEVASFKYLLEAQFDAEFSFPMAKIESGYQNMFVLPTITEIPKGFTVVN